MAQTWCWYNTGNIKSAERTLVLHISKWFCKGFDIFGFVRYECVQSQIENLKSKVIELRTWKYLSNGLLDHKVINHYHMLDHAYYLLIMLGVQVHVWWIRDLVPSGAVMTRPNIIWSCILQSNGLISLFFSRYNGTALYSFQGIRICAVHGVHDSV